jgi:hypothetical protein
MPNIYLRQGTLNLRDIKLYDPTLIGITLIVSDILQTQVIDDLSLVQHNLLTVSDISQLQTLDYFNLTQHNILAIGNLSQQNVIDVINLVQHNKLLVSDLTQTQTIGSLTLKIGETLQKVTLSVQNITIPQTISMISLRRTLTHSIYIKTNKRKINANLQREQYRQLLNIIRKNT